MARIAVVCAVFVVPGGLRVKAANLANRVHVVRDGVEALEYIFGTKRMMFDSVAGPARPSPARTLLVTSCCLILAVIGVSSSVLVVVAQPDTM